MAKSDSFVFYRSFYEAMMDVDNETGGQVFKAICMYALDGKTPKLTGVPSALFKLIKPQIDANQKRREAGSKGGKASVKARSENAESASDLQPKVNHTSKHTSKQNQANVNVNVNDNVNDNANVSVNVNDSVNDTNIKKNNSICSSSLVSVSVSNNKKDTDTTDTTTTNTDYLNVDFITEKIIELQKWSPDTSKSIARKFINLNDTHATVHHTSGWWQNRIDGFLAKETTPSDYAEWQSQQEEAKHILSKEKLKSLMASWDRANSNALAEDRRNAYEIWRDYNEIHHPDKQWEELPGNSNSTYDENGVPCVVTTDSIAYYHGGVVYELNNDEPMFV